MAIFTKQDQRGLKKDLDKVQKRVVNAGFTLEKEIKIMLTGMRSGETVEGDDQDFSTPHRRSKPGEPPAIEFNRLRSSISTNWSMSGMRRGPRGGSSKTATPEDTIGQPGGSKLKAMGKNFVVVVGTNVKYAPWLEFGTKRMKPRPFLVPAFQKAKNQMQRVLKIKTTLRSSTGVNTGGL